MKPPTITRVKAWFTLPTEFAALNVRLVLLIDVAVQLRLPVPLPLSTNPQPVGRVPLIMLKAGIGVPLAETVNTPGVRRVKIAMFGLVKTGAEPVPVRNVCIAALYGVANDVEYFGLHPVEL